MMTTNKPQTFTSSLMAMAERPPEMNAPKGLIFMDYMALMAAQLGHLGDGRRYQVKYWADGEWKLLGVVGSTVLCDYATRWLRENGAARACGTPVK